MYIYRAYLNDGRSYIGQTTDFEKRKKSHKKCSVRGTSKFYKAIANYGFDSFNWDIIEEVDDSVADERERYWIEYYDAYNSGFNSQTGGVNRYKLSDDAKSKIGDANRGRKRTEETIQKMKESHTGKPSGAKGKKWSEESKQRVRGRESTFKGKHHTAESIQKNKEAHLGKYKGMHWKVENGKRVWYSE